MIVERRMRPIIAGRLPGTTEMRVLLARLCRLELATRIFATSATRDEEEKEDRADHDYHRSDPSL